MAEKRYLLVQIDSVLNVYLQHLQYNFVLYDLPSNFKVTAIILTRPFCNDFSVSVREYTYISGFSSSAF